MPPSDWRVRFEDILEAVQRIERYTSDLTQETEDLPALVPLLERALQA